ncbi:DUF2059 domain-containing protein [Cribrihabitans neustonicus]|uniref:DUF2059 domain-containing protein n=1 Tax=Cribrihabitans neustonicus TaxID=1429085 RepID=UPI003B59FDA1
MTQILLLMLKSRRRIGAAGAFVFVILAGVLPAQAAERARIEAFLEVTGFDVALDSIAFSAAGAPELLGFDAGSFGAEWTKLSEEVFETSAMRAIALDILEQTLDEDALAHAAEFYETPLGVRLVAAENAAHRVRDEEVKAEAGERIIGALVKAGSPRVELFKRLGRAIDAADTGLKALQEIQFRFIMAAAAAGLIELDLDAAELRAYLAEQDDALRVALEASGLASSAYTYQGFTDAEVEAYAEALEHPKMQRVYELLNAVQYEITANRFEALAYRMKDLTPEQDI